MARSIALFVVLLCATEARTISKRQIKKLTPFHDALISYMLANARSSNRELAAEFHRSETWISIVLNSDVFRREFERRHRAMSATRDEAVLEKITRLANGALDVLNAKFEDDNQEVPAKFALEVADMTLKRLMPQFRPTQALQTNIQHNVVVSPEVIARARERALRYADEPVTSAPVRRELVAPSEEAPQTRRDPEREPQRELGPSSLQGERGDVSIDDEELR